MILPQKFRSFCLPWDCGSFESRARPSGEKVPGSAFLNANWDVAAVLYSLAERRLCFMSQNKNAPSGTTDKKSLSKKSIIVGGLIGTGGFFIAKAIGLVYSIPFSSILGSDALMSYYGSAYRIYSYLLNVFTAGAPMAIATMVAKYTTRKNYKTVLQIERLSTLFLGLLGLLGMIVMLALSGVLGNAMADGTPEGAAIMTRVLALLSIAIFFVPILSAYRGYVQGRKEMEEYAYSQAFEQLFRVAFLLGVSCLLVYGFHMANVYALYAAVLSTSVAAIAGIVQIVRFTRQSNKPLRKQAKMQKTRAVPLKPLIREFILLCIPYLLYAVIGYANDIYDAVLLPTGLRMSSYSSAQIQTMTSAVNYVGIKLTAIPMILSPGFVAAIIPHITSALETNDIKTVRKDIIECINIVLYIALFLSFCIFVYAKPLFYSLYYTTDLELAASSVRWIAIEGLFGTLTPIISSMMMACGMRRKLLRNMFVAAVVKGIIMVPMVMMMGIAGAVISTIISFGYIMAYSLHQMMLRYHVHFKSTLSLLIRTSIALALMGLTAWLLSLAGLGVAEGSKLMCLLSMCLNGLISAAVFLACSFYFRIPQQLFHFHLKGARR